MINGVCFLIKVGGPWKSVYFRHILNLKNIESRSLDKLGTISLRKLFFNGIPGSDHYYDEKKNPTPIYEQYENIIQFIDETLNKHLEDNLSFVMRHKGKYWLAYGLGTAILKSIPNLSEHKKHNMPVTAEFIKKTVDGIRFGFKKNNLRVMDIFEMITKLRGDWHEQKELDNRLTMLYGLPVYQKILERLGLTEIRAQSYGLRYAVYLACHLNGWGFDLNLRNEDAPAKTSVTTPIISKQDVLDSSPKKSLLEWAGGEKVTLGIVFTDVVGGSNLRTWLWKREDDKSFKRTCKKST